MEKISIIAILAVLSLAAVAAGCVTPTAKAPGSGSVAAPPGPPAASGGASGTSSFDASYTSTNTTSAGTAITTLAFQVRDGKVVYCSGQYTFVDNSGKTTVTPCDMSKLQNNEYPFNLQKDLMSYKKGDPLNGTVILGGQNHYSWYITPYTG